jgi:predicted HTH domain antitoxin
MILASKLYERGVLTMRQAAKFAGLSYREFMESLGSYGVSFMNYPAEEIARDVKNA